MIDVVCSATVLSGRGMDPPQLGLVLATMALPRAVLLCLTRPSLRAIRLQSATA